MNGGLAEYVTSPASICREVPEGCDDDAAAMAQPLAVALHALSRVALGREETVAVVGVVMALGLSGPHLSLWLTVFPAAGALALVALVVLVPRLGAGTRRPATAGRIVRAMSASRRGLVGGVEEALAILRAREPLLFLGAIGYWAWDNAVLWATFHAFGYSPQIVVVLMAYLIGQLGGLLPLPGGLGGIDGGLFGAFVVYGAPAAVTAAAVLAYRIILFWLPLLVGSVTFVSLRRGLNRPDRPDLCVVPAAS